MRFSQTLTASALLACGPTSPLSGATTTSDSTTSPDASTHASEVPTTTTATTTTSGSASTAAIATGTGTTLHDFIVTLDGPVDLPDCDPLGQDCPAGQKCVPWHESGPWSGARCVDITGDGAPGDPCTAPEGEGSGVDDCALGSICWDLDEQNHGTCVAQCTGSQTNLTCPPKHGCNVAQGYYLNLCFPACIPFPDDCPETSLCIPYQLSFFCEPDDLGPKAQVNEPCDNTLCAKGLVCIPASEASSACDIGPCCQPYCELPNAPCPNPDQQCIPWFDGKGSAPPGYETIGFCGIPK